MGWLHAGTAAVLQGRMAGFSSSEDILAVELLSRRLGEEGLRLGPVDEVRVSMFLHRPDLACPSSLIA